MKYNTKMALIAAGAIFVATIAYTTLKGYGFDTIEGVIITHIVPAIVAALGMMFFAKPAEDGKSKSAQIIFGASVFFVIVFVEVCYRNIDNIFY